ncbi:PAS domain S-box protein [Gillisia sp. M10.2A]|uniref:histidine kinase n=1 Tax=Gillisia lutea TaxID=2909668 RepID=A0ABS9EEH0_9FLAO|nr:PAS domain S-box protein [Gillisia lutea]MCF4101258.1 PAS domain S-box protein [Gillisia lutea]
MKFKSVLLKISVLTFVLGVLVLFGWFFNISILKTVLPGYTSMVANTAISFIISSMILFLAVKKLSKIARYVSLLLLIFSLSTLSQDVFNFNLGIDELFIEDTSYIENVNSSPGRMALTTALSFVLLSVAFLLLLSKRSVKAGQFMLHMVSLIAFIGITGYLYRISPLDKIAVLSSMAIHTSLALFFFSAAASLLNPKVLVAGLFTGNRIGNKMARRIFPTFLLTLLALGFIRVVAHRFMLVSVDSGIALFVISGIVVGLFLIWDTAQLLNNLDQKRTFAENELKKSYNNLENIVSLRTSELTQSVEKLKEKELTLWKSEQLLKGVINNAASTIFVKDKQGNYLMANNTFTSKYINGDEKLEDKTAYDLFPEELADKLTAEDPEIFSSGKSTTYEVVAPGADGESVLLINKFALFDEYNNIYALCGMATDVTLLKKAEANIRAVFNSASVSIIETDVHGVITHFNKGAEFLLGYKEEEVIGIEKPTIFHTQEELCARGKELSKLYKKPINGFDALVEFAKQGKHESKEWLFVKKNGETFPVQLVFTAIKDEYGTITGYLGIASDISDLNSAKYDLEILTNQLQKQNSQLLNFAHITSHNLRSPVSNLNSLMHFYQESTSVEDKEMLFTKFETVINHLTSTLNELIEALKIQEDKSQKVEMVKFQDIFKKINETFVGNIMETNAKITFNFTEAESIEYSKSYMESIMLNLFSNALKYRSPERIPEIHFETKRKEEEISLLVSDNGLGIDMKRHRKKLFGLNKTFHRHSEAKGVGLFITKTQVEAMGGRISAESEVDKGTIFKITFNKQNSNYE